MDWFVELLGTIVEGGPVMVPIALSSLIAFGAFLERLYALRRDRIAPLGLARELEPLLRDGAFDQALKVCRARDGALARLIEAAILFRSLPRAEMRDRLEELGRFEAASMERFIPIIGTVASVAPLLGLLGTVGGMIVTFATIQDQGMGDIDKLAGGISQALVTTFAGLSVGIPALIGNRYLLARVDRLLLELEQHVGRAVVHVRARPTEEP